MSFSEYTNILVLNTTRLAIFSQSNHPDFDMEDEAKTLIKRFAGLVATSMKSPLVKNPFPLI